MFANARPAANHMVVSGVTQFKHRKAAENLGLVEGSLDLACLCWYGQNVVQTIWPGAVPEECLMNPSFAESCPLKP